MPISTRTPIRSVSQTLLVDCWEGATLRSRLKRGPSPLGAMLDFYFGAAGASANAVER